MTLPSVTAIILTYDRLPMLQRTVTSARWQTHDDLQILVVDNGSAPETGRWLASLADPRITILRFEENTHPTVARNAALTEATGLWVGFLDDDDLWAPDKVEAMLRAAQQQDAVWAYCGCVYIDPDDRVLGGRAPMPVERTVEALPVTYTIPGGLSGMMWRKDALDEEGLLDERMTYCEDWDTALRLLRVTPPAIVDRPLMAYRQHPGAWSRQVAGQAHEYDLVAEKHAALRGERNVRRGTHYRYVAAQAARAGERREAVHHYMRALSAGDLASIPRLIGALLPTRLGSALRRWLLSDRAWMADGQRWVDDVRLQLPSSPS